MDFCIVPSIGQVTVDDASITGVDCSSISANVYIVDWSKSAGTILYYDRVALRDSYTDPTPYLPIINNWLLAAAGQTFGTSAPHSAGPPLTGSKTPAPISVSPFITLKQAVAIKGNINDALFALKRQAPITFQGQTYDGSDTETSAMSTAISGAAQQNIDAANSALSNLTSSVNSANATTVSNVNAANADFGGPAGQVDANMDTIFAATGFPIEVVGVAVLNVDAPADIIAPTITGPAMSWPNSSGVSQNLSFAQMSGLVKALADRRATLQTTHIAMKAAIAAQTSVAGIAGIDITAGW
jgi:hypothetical protein